MAAEGLEAAEVAPLGAGHAFVDIDSPRQSWQLREDGVLLAEQNVEAARRGDRGEQRLGVELPHLGLDGKQQPRTRFSHRAHSVAPDEPVISARMRARMRSPAWPSGLPTQRSNARRRAVSNSAGDGWRAKAAARSFSIRPSGESA